MASFRSNKEQELIFDTIRGRLVEKTPEECVRQRLLKYMQEVCGFPASLIAVEKSLKEMPHLETMPDSLERRVDIVCFARDLHPLHSLYPLLLVECKAVPLSAQAVHQAFGYNSQVGASFLLLANLKQLRLYFPDRTIISYLPHYQELVKMGRSFYEPK
jgi:hypothetical protein